MENDLLGIALGLGRDSAAPKRLAGGDRSIPSLAARPEHPPQPDLQLIFGEGLPGRDVRLAFGMRGQITF